MLACLDCLYKSNPKTIKISGQDIWEGGASLLCLPSLRPHLKETEAKEKPHAFRTRKIPVMWAPYCELSLNCFLC